ncbi:protein obstructor-E-like [Homarus americanus]|uniref:Obstructor-E-like 5 n=1 Tax=Homarus americanus TaxID=6706 RepID=A0A8J5K248_HOMAM|nr:protein obstructor-E-like [Homarus americanus]KAG7168615.1 obstructor-E-like 5 [Homarus americanus]
MYKLGILLFVGVATAQQFQCIEDGYFGDPHQCDKYYDCYRGAVEEKMCPDGLVFDRTLSPKVEQCNYPFIVSCPEGSSLQPPKPVGIECPRQNGYFEHENPANCAEYYECTGGEFVLRSCATGLVFDEFTGTCQWAHTGIRANCGQVKRVLDGFTCPNGTQLHTNGQVLDHSRYLKEGDCRYFYVCNEGLYPRLVGCPQGTVFNDISLTCDDPSNVPGCENYYPADEFTSPLKKAGL